MSQQSVLDFLKQNDGWVNVRDIVSGLGLSKGSVGCSLNRLKKDCLVKSKIYFNAKGRPVSEYRLLKDGESRYS